MILSPSKTITWIVLFSYLHVMVQGAFANIQGFERSDVYFEVERRGWNNGVLSLKAMEKDKILFQTDMQEAQQETEYCIEKNPKGYQVFYQHHDHTSFSFLVNDIGDILLDADLGSRCTPGKKKWGFKTFGKIVNEADLSLEGLFTYSQEWINQGSLALKDFNFSYLYFYNSGLFHIAKDTKEFKPHEIRQKLKDIVIPEAPTYQKKTFNNEGYFYSEYSLNFTGFHTLNKGYMDIQGAHFLKNAALTVHKPVHIHGHFSGKAQSVINKSHLHVGKTTFLEAETLVNKGVITTQDPLGFKNAFSLINNKGVIISPPPAGQDGVTTLGGWDSHHAFYKAFIHPLNPSFFVKKGAQTPEDHNFKVYKTNTLVSAVITSWLKQGLAGTYVRQLTDNHFLSFINKLISHDKGTPLSFLAQENLGTALKSLGLEPLNTSVFQRLLQNPALINKIARHKINLHQQDQLRSSGILLKSGRHEAKKVLLQNYNPFLGISLSILTDQKNKAKTYVTITTSKESQTFTYEKGVLTSKPTALLSFLGSFQGHSDGGFYLKNTSQENTALRITSDVPIVLDTQRWLDLEIEAPLITFKNGFKARHVTVTPQGPSIHKAFCRFQGTAPIHMQTFTQKGGYVSNKAPWQSEESLTLALLNGIFKNHHPLESKDLLSLGGRGTLLNESVIQAACISSSLKALWNGGTLHSQTFLEDSTYFLNGGHVLISQKGHITSRHLKNQGGKIFSGGTLNLLHTHMDNSHGEAGGLKGTKVHIIEKYHSDEGLLGDQGETQCRFLPKNISHLGTIKGKTIDLSSAFLTSSTQAPLSWQNGFLWSEEKVTLEANEPRLRKVVIDSPQLLLKKCRNFQLDPQSLCAQTILETLYPTLTFPYQTAGELILRIPGITSKEDYENAYKKYPQGNYTFALLATIEAYQGLSIFAPFTQLTIGSNTVKPTLDISHSTFKAYVNSVDLEQGLIAAQNGEIMAPKGISIGRLIEDSTRSLFSTFYCHAYFQSSRNLGGDAEKFSGRFLGKDLKNIYDGRHMLMLPVATSNQATLLIKNDLFLQGGLKLQGLLKTHTLEWDNINPSEILSGQLIIGGNLKFKNRGIIKLERLLQSLIFTQWAYWGTRKSDRITWQFINSNPAEFYVKGHVSSEVPILISNHGSVLHFHSKSPSIAINGHDMQSSLHQLILDWPLEKRRALFNSTLPQKCDISVSYPQNSYADNGCSWVAMQFLQHTNNFKDSQTHFPARTSFGGSVVLPADNTKIEGMLSAPMAIFKKGNGSLVLGTQNPFYIPPKEPIRDLMQRVNNSHLIYMPENIQEIFDSYKKAQCYFFMMRERFWFDNAQAQAFYQAIKDHVYVRTPQGTFRLAQGHTVFSLSPQFLLTRVQEECQEVLMRGFIYEDQPLDEACVQQLHRNTTDYLKAYKLTGEDLEKALAGKNPRVQAPTKPLIFYVALMNDLGVEELKPYLVFPPALHDEVRAQRGGLIRVNTLAILPQGISLEEIKQAFKDRPSMQRTLNEFLDRNPKVAAALTAPAEKPRLPLGDEVKIQGAVQVDTLALISDGPVTIHGDIKGKEGLIASLFRGVTVESLKERVYYKPDSFYEHIPQPARLAMDKILTILAADNIIFKGAQTQSGPLGTHIKSLANILDVPVELISQHVEHLSGKTKGTIKDTYHRQQTSDHKSSGDVNLDAKKKVELYGTKIEGDNINITGVKGVDLNDVHDIHINEENLSKKGSGPFAKTTHRQSQSASSTSKGCDLKANHKNTVNSPKGNINAINLSVESKNKEISEFNAPNGTVYLKAGVNTFDSQRSKNGQSLMWNSGKAETQHDVTYSPCQIKTPLEIRSKKTFIDVVMGQGCASKDQIRQLEGQLVDRVLHEIHQRDVRSYGGPGIGLQALVCLAVTMATAGMGTAVAVSMKLAADGLAAAMFSAGITTMATQGTIGMRHGGGNPTAGLKAIFRPDTLKALVISMGAAGIMNGLELPQKALLEKATYNFTKAAVHGGLSAAVHGGDVKDAIENILRDTVASTIGQHFAEKIGAQYTDKAIDPLTHKLLHGAVGAAAAEVMNRDAAAGALGALVAESLAEILKDQQQDTLKKLVKENPKLTQTQILHLYEKDLQTQVKFIKLETATVALLVGKDVQTAFDAGVNALENNGLLYLAARAAPILGAIFIPDTLDTLVETADKLAEITDTAYKISEEKGEEAALQYLADEGLIMAIGAVYKLPGNTIVIGAKKAWGAARKQFFKNHKGIHRKPTLHETDKKASAVKGKEIKKEGKNESKADKVKGHLPNVGEQFGRREKGYVRTNEELVQDIATRAERKIGESGRVAGIKKHAYAKKVLEKHKKIKGDRGLKPEQTWKDGKTLEPKQPTKGSARLDVVDTTNKKVYEYKFVEKPDGTRPAQMKKIAKHGPKDAEIVIINPKKPPAQ